MTKSKIYDDLKIFMTFFVILGHITRMYTPDGAFIPVIGSSFLSHLTDFIYQYHMPIFFMISGMIYGMCIENGKYKDKKKYLKNKARRLLVPYFVVGIFYVAPTMILCRLTSEGYFQYVFRGIILAENTRHLWYLLTLFWIFALIPLVENMLKRYPVLSLFILFSFSYYSYLFPTVFQIRSMMLYAFYFSVGIFFNHFYDQVVGLYFKSKRSILLVFLFGIVIGYFADIQILMKSSYKFFLISIMIAVCIEFHYGKKDRIVKYLHHTRIYHCLKINSFGIYLWHPMIIYVLFYLLKDNPVNPYFFTGIVFIIGLFLSILITESIRKVKQLRSIIGER